MRRLVRRLRSWYDYISFLASNESPLLLSVAGVILGAVTILPSSVGIVLGAVAFVLGWGYSCVTCMRLGAGGLTMSSPASRRRSRPQSSNLLPPTQIRLTCTYRARGTALVSDPVDRAVASQPMDARLDEEPYRLPKSLKGSARYVLPKMNHGRLVFNGRVIGMRGDPLPPGATPPPPVRLHIARFFDGQCSNEMCTFKITHRSGEPGFDPRTELLTNANGQLRTLAESNLADGIGISTIAVTADNALVVTRQTARNIASPRLLAPSGSGSLDPRDLGPASTGRPRREEILQDLVRHGMERELQEETGIRQDEIRHTKVIGFARWLERGARPEFFGITELSVTVQDLKEQRRLTSDERLYTDGTFTLKIDLPRLGRELAGGTDLLSAPSLSETIKDEGSLPLLLALRAAALHYVSAVR